MENVKLEIGKLYRNNIGLEIRIIKKEDGYYYSDEGIPYFENGDILISGVRKTDHTLCIVGPAGCNCFERILKELESNLKPTKPHEEFKIDWADKVLRFDGGLGVGLYIASEYYSIKKNGNRYINKTKNKNFMALSFCPFCGSKIKK